jgi:Polysaccharide biosynthesis protein
MGRISRQSGIVFAGTIFTAVFGYAFKVYLARTLGAEALGVYALGMTIISFLAIINVLGLPEAAERFVALYTASRNSRSCGRLVELLMDTAGHESDFLREIGQGESADPYHFYLSPQLVQYPPLFARS